MIWTFSPVRKTPALSVQGRLVGMKTFLSLVVILMY